MLKPFCLFLNFLTVLIFLTALFTFGYWCVLTMDVHVPKDILHHIETYLTPFLEILRNHFGIHYQNYKGRKVELTYGMLVVVQLLVFMALMWVSSLVASMDSQITRFLRHSVREYHQFRMNMAENKIIRTSEGNVWAPESGSLLAIRLENIEQYPDLEDLLFTKLSALTPTQRIFSSQDKFMYMFPTTSAATIFAYEFLMAFKKAQTGRMLKLESQPVLRLAVQSIASNCGVGDEEGFIWALLNCVGLNEIYIGLQAKEQFDIQQRDTAYQLPFKITRVGMYSQLGHRTFADVFRLTCPDDAYKEAG